MYLRESIIISLCLFTNFTFATDTESQGAIEKIDKLEPTATIEAWNAQMPPIDEDVGYVSAQFAIAKRYAIQTLTADEATTSELCMYECQQKDWSGACKRRRIQDDRCINRLFTGSSSMGPDKGLNCTMYAERWCAGDSEEGFVWPGWAKDWSKDAWRGVFKSAPQSYRCKGGKRVSE